MATLILKPLTFSSGKKLACVRLDEAQMLYQNRKYSGAYYLAGYAVELGIKAFFCKSVRNHTFPPKPKVVNKLYKHDLNVLMETCGLKIQFDEDKNKDSSLGKAWITVKDWNEQSRYSKIKKEDSESMINAVDIIFNWIKTKW